MPRIIYITSDDKRFEIEAQNGATVMETAINAGVPGIDAECGGACSCATCHVYVDASFAETLGGAGPMEADMLDFAWEATPNSRLSCQIKVSDALDGLVLRLPERQS
ncbi:2Fe-2S iron-sulfur cluster-binding protein [Aminobacter sp. AP02]|uniref:2Fe-2S iron-sulfur cluster-binding protein n=1 Tax=Aminobacter sp. AP02 TaxID=2135737 RepID=UPI000D6C8D4F|nr:2Fe-2S iron-sulfur cluster-binding protein [Aminobacter sp. AP02]PWK61764.1 2Fe-2S ferredoxin [Aminobacter sp. AP02]